MIALLFLACTVVATVNADWQLQSEGVCFGAKGSAFGSFKVKRSGIIRGIKLVHEEGQVNCRKNSNGRSFWGCNSQSLSTFITNTDDKVIFPKTSMKNAWFKLSNYSSQSKELVFNTPASRTRVEAGQTLRLWYGEDLKHYKEGDNSGESCAAVYAVITPDWQLQGKKVCFGAKGSKFGTFKVRKSGKINKIRLVHVSGYVSCRKSSKSRSNWGCGSKQVGAVITNTDDKVLFPKSAVNKVWFTVPQYNSKSPELVYNTPARSTIVKAGQTLRLWFGEDLKHSTESDNNGESCADVYADISAA